MSFFKNIFGDKENSEGNKMWINISNSDDLEEALTQSEKGKIAIFKHSTRCHISKTVLRNFENEMHNDTKNITFYFLDLIENRSVSNEIAEKLNVTHQSPQLLVIDNRKVIKHSSHSDISMANL